MASSGSEGAQALTFYFDFASPYAYSAFNAAVRLADEAGIELQLRPALVWAVLKAQGIPAPFETPARKAYMLADMARSAAFHGMAYRHPDRLPISAHLAARLWLGVANPAARLDLARRIFRARFVDGADICDRQVLTDLARQTGLEPDYALALIDDPANAEALRASVAEAVAVGAPGIPFFRLGDEGFFGADRLAQIRWRLGLPPAPKA